MALSENYFKSRDVRVFPSSFRGTYNTTTFDPEARLNTEANFIAPKISGNKASYIVNYTTNKIKFVLGGYYFEINNITAYNLNDKYLNIKLREFTIAENQNDANKDSERRTSLLDTWEENNDHILDYLDSEDSISYFSGLKISSISPESVAYASIKLFDAEGNLNQEAILVDLDHGKGANTLMHGVGLTADTINQTVFGTYNNNKVDTLFEVGKGSSETNKNNALEISPTTTTINNATNINGNTIITGSTKIDGTAEITNNTEIKGDLTISKDTESTSSTTGALKVTGGAGINKNLNVGGDANLNNKLIVKTSPADTETNVKINGTLNVTGKTDIYSNVTIDSEKTTLAKPVEITDDSIDALKVKGKTTIEKDLEVGNSTKILTVKNSPDTGEQNVTITGTLKSTGKATFGEGLEVASGKTTTLGGQVDITGAVNINTSNQDDPEEITIYGDTTITGDVEITGAVAIEGKATSTSTASTDEATTLTTKDYVDGKFDALDFTATSDETTAESATGNYIQSVTQKDGKVSTKKYSFDKTINDSSTDKNAPTSKAVESRIESKLSELSLNQVGTKTVSDKTTYAYIKTVSQNKGKLEALTGIINTNLTEFDASSTEDGTLPTAKTVKKYVVDATAKLNHLNLSYENYSSINVGDYTIISGKKEDIGFNSHDEGKCASWAKVYLSSVMDSESAKKYEIVNVVATETAGHEFWKPETWNIGKNGGGDYKNGESTLHWSNNIYIRFSNNDQDPFIAFFNAHGRRTASVNWIAILKRIRN